MNQDLKETLVGFLALLPALAACLFALIIFG